MVGPPAPSWEVDITAVAASEVRQGIWRLRLPSPWDYVSHVNAYALDGTRGGIVLIDCGGGGHPTTWRSLRIALRQAGRSVEDITDLLITHRHTDHLGLAATLVAHTGCRVWGHPDGAHFDDVLRDADAAIAARAAAARREGVPPELIDSFADVREETEGTDGPVQADDELTAGVELPVRAGALEVIEAPGHAPSQVCLYLQGRAILFAADLLGPQFAPFYEPQDATDAVAQQLASLDAVSQLSVELALCGHGRPIRDLAGVLALWRDGVSGQVAGVAVAVARHPNASAFELRGALAEAGLEDATPDVLALWLVRAYLVHLAARGRITRTLAPDGIWRHDPA